MEAVRSGGGEGRPLLPVENNNLVTPPVWLRGSGGAGPHPTHGKINFRCKVIAPESIRKDFTTYYFHYVAIMGDGRPAIMANGTTHLASQQRGRGKREKRDGGGVEDEGEGETTRDKNETGRRTRTRYLREEKLG